MQWTEADNTRAGCCVNFDRLWVKARQQIFGHAARYFVTARERREGRQNQAASIREKDRQLLRCARCISYAQARVQVANHQRVRFNHRRELQPVSVNRGYGFIRPLLTLLDRQVPKLSRECAIMIASNCSQSGPPAELQQRVLNALAFRRARARRMDQVA